MLSVLEPGSIAHAVALLAFVCMILPAPPAKETFFLPYQVKWIRDNARMKIMRKSRQVGMSLTAAYGMLRKKATKAAKLDGWVSSRDALQAKLFLEDCSGFARALNIAAKDLGQVLLDADKKTSAYALSFANGRRIHSMSSNPDAQAGKRGDRLLDEFALHPDPRKLFAISRPGLTWGGQMEIISTLRGSDNYFNELLIEITERGNPKGFSLHTVTLHDAIEQGFLRKLQAKLPDDDERKFMSPEDYVSMVRAECPDEETFQQEYLCVPADDSTSFLSFDLIASCEYDEQENWSLPYAPQNVNGNRYGLELAAGLEIKGPLFLGVDVGRDHDLTVFWLFEELGDVFHTRAVIELEAAPFAEQEAIFYSLLEDRRLRRACVDRTGIGRQFCERAQVKFGEYRVEAVNFTAGVKEELAYPVRRAFELRALRIPPERFNRFIRPDLRSVKKEITSSGNIRFAADRGKNGHADRFWALALGLHAGKRAAPPGQIRAFTGRTGRNVRPARSRALAG